MDNFVKKQWNDFCGNLERTAKHLAGSDEALLGEFLNTVNEFRGSNDPGSNSELLKSIVAGTELAVQWQARRGTSNGAGNPNTTNAKGN